MTFIFKISVHLTLWCAPEVMFDCLYWIWKFLVRHLVWIYV